MKRFMVSLLLLLFSASSFALNQVKSFTENQTLLVTVSGMTLNRIFVKGDRIIDVKGDAGTYNLKNDPVDGSIYIQPSPDYIGKTFSIFVSTEAGRHVTLWLAPESVPAATIELDPVGGSQMVAAGWEQGSQYTNLLTSIIKNMINGVAPDGYGQTAVTAKPVQIVGLSIQLVMVYNGMNLQGQIYNVTNTSNHAVFLSEDQFYDTGVRAIALSNLSLNPAETGVLYKVVDHVS